jgi:pyruvate,water dikinase
MSTAETVMAKGRPFAPPGKGPWELDSTHFTAPATYLAQHANCDGFPRGFRFGTARYGLMLSHLEPGYVQSMLYHQPVAVGAPPGAMKPPPKLVLQVLSRVHPELRRRARTAERAFAEKRWREDLARWDEVDKPAAVAAHRAIQAVDVGALDDAALADHVDRCLEHAAEGIFLHHKYTIPACLPVGDFLAGAQEWTGASVGELMALLRGRSEVSQGFASDELDAAAKALTTSDDARAVLAGDQPSTRILEALSTHPEVGREVTAYLDAVRWRCVGYDVGDKTAGELPDALVGALRATLAGAAVVPDDEAALEEIRSRVPAEHLEDFDDRLAEVRLIYRLRDERGVYADGWAMGLLRRAMLEVGRRLAGSGAITAAEHAVDLRPEEVRPMLLGTATEPTPEELAERFEWRRSTTSSDVPPYLRAMPAPPPPPDWLPRGARRAAAAMDVFLGSLFGVPESPNTETVLTGLAVNSGVYEGTARRVDSSDDFGRIEPGDILVTRATSPYFNVVLPMLGAIVTDRGGQLCHAAIVAREYGIPGIVGTRDATARIADGARIRVDGTSGEVRLLG